MRSYAIGRKRNNEIEEKKKRTRKKEAKKGKGKEKKREKVMKKLCLEMTELKRF